MTEQSPPGGERSPKKRKRGRGQWFRTALPASPRSRRVRDDPDERAANFAERKKMRHVRMDAIESKIRAEVSGR